MICLVSNGSSLEIAVMHGRLLVMALKIEAQVTSGQIK